MEATSSSPSPFSFPDGDVILRSADGADLRVHTTFLSIASPFFRDMFSLPQISNEMQTIEMTEKTDVLVAILELIYPLEEPSPYATELALDIYKAADKLQIIRVQPIAQRRLCAWLEDDDLNPLEAWAIAVQLGIPEAILSAKRRFISADTTDCLKEFPDSLKEIPVEKYAALTKEKETATQKAWENFTAVITCEAYRSGSCVYCLRFTHHYRSTIRHAQIFTSRAIDPKIFLNCHTCAKSQQHPCVEGLSKGRESSSFALQRSQIRESLSATLSNIS